MAARNAPDDGDDDEKKLFKIKSEPNLYAQNAEHVVIAAAVAAKTHHRPKRMRTAERWCFNPRLIYFAT